MGLLCDGAWFVVRGALFVVMLLAGAARGEAIRSFDVELRLKPDSSLEVIETITMDFERAQRHGIWRIIPVRYDRYGNSYSIYLRILSVTDAAGNEHRYSAARQGRDLGIKIGDPDRTVSGVQTYRIHYVARRAVNFFSEAPEVYWNATGNDWPFAIGSATVKFFPPDNVPIADVRAASFAGRYGSQQSGEISRHADHVRFEAGNFSPGEGLTIVAGLPAGSVTPPAVWTQIGWWLADWWPAAALPVAALLVMFGLWHRSGRDVGGGAAIPVEWNPPKDLSPAEVGTLIDERCQMPDIVSTLIDLAARGYVKIRETESTRFLFFSGRDYEFEKLEPPAGAPALLPHEATFLAGLFERRQTHVSLSDLKEKFYVHLPPIRKAIYHSLSKKHFFKANPDGVRATYYAIGIVMLFGALVAGVLGFQIGQIAWAVGLGISGLIVLLFAPAMPAKTHDGSIALRQCLGFRRFLSLVEKDRIAAVAKDDPTIFGRLLPYAMVLGVADQWAEAFADLIREPPQWYVPYDRRPFSSRIFLGDLGAGMSAMGRTLSSRPAPKGGSSAGGGGSGFSGGFSGGGFGGGGGRSW